MERNVDHEGNLMRRLARRLEQTEQEIAALPEDQRVRVVQYLHARFGWFVRGTPGTGQS